MPIGIFTCIFHQIDGQVLYQYAIVISNSVGYIFSPVFDSRLSIGLPQPKLYYFLLSYGVGPASHRGVRTYLLWSRHASLVRDSDHSQDT